MQCFPLRRIWEIHTGGHCLNVGLAATILAVFNALTDIVILVIPIPVLWKMQMEMKLKLQIIAVFLLGGLYVLPAVVGGHRLTGLQRVGV